MSEKLVQDEPLSPLPKSRIAVAAELENAIKNEGEKKEGPEHGAAAKNGGGQEHGVAAKNEGGPEHGAAAKNEGEKRESAIKNEGAKKEGLEHGAAIKNDGEQKERIAPMATQQRPAMPMGNEAVPEEKVPEKETSKKEEKPKLNEAKKEAEKKEEKPACKFAVFGCNIETPDHEPKRPAKHLTLFNDALLEQYRESDVLTESQEDALMLFTRQKLVVNSIICRNSAQLIWRIPAFSVESRKAKLRLSEPLRSESFYSEPFGYRLQAVLAPYGMNQAYGDALSFYIQLLPGDYDPILRWPFDSKVLFSLYDQNPEATKRMDFRYELVPNTSAINQMYIGRPVPEAENGLLGVESFVGLDQLFDGTYIQNDVLIIGISIYD